MGLAPLALRVPGTQGSRRHRSGPHQSRKTSRGGRGHTGNICSKPKLRTGNTCPLPKEWVFENNKHAHKRESKIIERELARKMEELKQKEEELKKLNRLLKEKREGPDSDDEDLIIPMEELWDKENFPTQTVLQQQNLPANIIEDEQENPPAIAAVQPAARVESEEEDSESEKEEIKAKLKALDLLDVKNFENYFITEYDVYNSEEFFGYNFKYNKEFFLLIDEKGIIRHKGNFDD